MKWLFTLTVAMGVLLLAGSEAFADKIVDEFNVVLDGNNDLVSGTSTGWEDGQGNTWLEYPQSAGPSWWNTWFINPPVERAIGKEIIVAGTLLLDDFSDPTVPAPLPPFGYDVEVAINWSTRDYANPDMPPQPGEEDSIQREVIFADTLPVFFPIAVEDTLFLDYCPLWISMDIRVTGAELDPLLTPGEAEQALVDYAVAFDGAVSHECKPVPEPASMSLWGLVAVLGGGVLTRRRRRS